MDEWMIDNIQQQAKMTLFLYNPEKGYASFASHSDYLSWLCLQLTNGLVAT